MFGEQGKVRYACSIECIRQDRVGERKESKRWLRIEEWRQFGGPSRDKCVDTEWDFPEQGVWILFYTLVFLKMHQKHLGGLLKTQIAEPHSQNF